jgi:hypothetical protein
MDVLADQRSAPTVTAPCSIGLKRVDPPAHQAQLEPVELLGLRGLADRMGHRCSGIRRPAAASFNPRRPVFGGVLC